MERMARCPASSQRVRKRARLAPLLVAFGECHRRGTRLGLWGGMESSEDSLRWSSIKRQGTAPRREERSKANWVSSEESFKGIMIPSTGASFALTWTRANSLMISADLDRDWEQWAKTTGGCFSPMLGPDADSEISEHFLRWKEKGSISSMGSIESFVLNAHQYSARRARSWATGISATGSSVRDTRMVSPKPSRRREPIPIALLIRASSPSPASVTPKWRG